MIKEHFKIPTKTEWLHLLERELKGESLDRLMKFNRIEEINLPSYFHADDLGSIPSDPGKFPYTRGFHSETASWEHGTCFRIVNEQTARTEILAALNAGTTSLHLHPTTQGEINFEILLDGVELAYIQTHFYPLTIEQALAFDVFTGNVPKAIHGNLQPILLKSERSVGISGYAVQQAGGTTWQEISIALAEGHDALLQGIEAGLTVQEAAKRIHFLLGIGSSFFYEVAKFRTLRTLWSLILRSYDKTIDCSTTITARTGVLHYSAKDPYTNLLRQTTEAMSALLGGANELVIEPYDWYTTEQNTAFTRRMATNISLLLQEEAQFGTIVDALGGSYVLEGLTETITERAWSEFQRIEKAGGIQAAEIRSQLTSEIEQKAAQRIELVKSGAQQLIGINKYAPSNDNGVTWETLPNAWNGLQTLQLELACQQ